MTRVITLATLDEWNKSPTQRAEERVNSESDEEIMERLKHKFDILHDMTRATKMGHIRAMIVSGPPGVGKSFGVEAELARHDTFATVAQDERFKKYEVVKGAMSALGLYAKLHAYKDDKSILVFDDCDSVLLDDLSLNILKAALDSSNKRMIHWNTDSRLLKDEGIPNSFEFKGGCIFITNIKFEHIKSKKLKDDLEALESRCHFLDLSMDTDREKILRIRQVLRDTPMLEKFKFTSEQHEEIINYIDTNKKQLREVSLRMVLKIAALVASFPDRWQAMVKATCMKGAV